MCSRWTRTRSPGPQFLLFGFGLSNSFNGQGAFNLQIGHRYPWLTPGGLEWRNDRCWAATGPAGTPNCASRCSTASVSTSPLCRVQPQAHRCLSRQRLRPPRHPADRLPCRHRPGGDRLRRADRPPGEFRAGLNYQQVQYSPSYNVTSSSGRLFPSGRVSQPTVRAQLTIDQLDDPQFPRKGYYLLATNEMALGGTDNRFDEAYAKALWAASVGRHTLNGGRGRHDLRRSPLELQLQRRHGLHAGRFPARQPMPPTSSPATTCCTAARPT